MGGKRLVEEENKVSGVQNCRLLEGRINYPPRGMSESSFSDNQGVKKRKIFPDERAEYAVMTTESIQDKEEGLKYINSLLKNVISSHENPVEYVTRDDINMGAFDVYLTRQEAESLEGVKGVRGLFRRFQVTSGHWIFLNHFGGKKSTNGEK